MFINYGWKKPKLDPSKRRKATNAMPRFYRVGATLRRERGGQVIAGRIILSDLSAVGVGIFLPAPVAKGESISLVIGVPQSIYLKGTIEWCGYYNLSSRVLSVENLVYRAYVKFHFESAQEREAFCQFMF